MVLSKDMRDKDLNLSLVSDICELVKLTVSVNFLPERQCLV